MKHRRLNHFTNEEYTLMHLSLWLCPLAVFSRLSRQMTKNIQYSGTWQGEQVYLKLMGLLGSAESA